MNKQTTTKIKQNKKEIKFYEYRDFIIRTVLVLLVQKTGCRSRRC